MLRATTIRVVLSLALLALAFAPASQADVWNKKTIVTFSEPVELPTGVVLQPGKYVMKLADSQSNRHIVQVFNEREDQILATILAIPNYRLQPSGDTVITFHETAAGTNKPMRAWFYPGDNFGQEFAFPKDRATQITAVTQQEVRTLSPEDEAFMAARVETQPAPSEQAAAPAPAEPAPAPQAETPRADVGDQPVAEAAPRAEPEPAEPEPAAEPEALPATASNLPLMLLGGLLSLAGAATLRKYNR